MTSQQIQTHSPDELAFLLDLETLVGADDVQPVPGGFLVTFPEADFVVRLSSHASSACETEWEVTVREPEPGLSTWWGRWRRTFSVHRSDAGPLIAAEVREAISRVRDMLEDHARGLEDLAV